MQTTVALAAYEIPTPLLSSFLALRQTSLCQTYKTQPERRARTHTDIHTDTQTHTYTRHHNTYRHTHTQTHRHIHTQDTATHTDTQTDTQTHTYTRHHNTYTGNTSDIWEGTRIWFENLMGMGTKGISMRILRAHGTTTGSIQVIFNTVVVAKLTYHVSSWWGFMTAEDSQRLEALIRRSIRSGLSAPDHMSLEDLVTDADDRLFNRILYSKQHVLHSILPCLLYTSPSPRDS